LWNFAPKRPFHMFSLETHESLTSWQMKFTHFWRLQGLQWLVQKLGSSLSPSPSGHFGYGHHTSWRFDASRFVDLLGGKCVLVFHYGCFRMVTPYTSSHNHGSQTWVLPVIVVIYLSNIAIFNFHENGRKSNAKQCKTYLCRTLRVVHVYFRMADFWSQKKFGDSFSPSRS